MRASRTVGGGKLACLLEEQGRMKSMKTSLRILAACTVLTLAGCNSQKATEDLVQARLDAEKVQEQATAMQDLKTANEQLKKENDELKLKLALTQAKIEAITSQKRVARATPAPKSASATKGEKPAPAEIQQLHSELTGGGSFK